MRASFETLFRPVGCFGFLEGGLQSGRGATALRIRSDATLRMIAEIQQANAQMHRLFTTHSLEALFHSFGTVL